MSKGRLKAVVIQTSKARKQGRACDMREIVNIAASLAKKRERVKQDIAILDICFFPNLGVHVAVYLAPDSRMTSPGVQGRSVKR